MEIIFEWWIQRAVSNDTALFSCAINGAVIINDRSVLLGLKNLHYSLLPQLPQNFVPGSFWVQHSLHLPGVGGGALRFVPQLLQNFTVWAFCAPQEGHTFSAMEAPQLLQNLPFPAGLPQEGQMVVLLSISPSHTVAAAPFSSMLRFMASALALAT